jgi:hypothetical protein
MTQGRRIALIAATVVIAVVAFIVLKPDDKKETTGSSQTTTPAAPSGSGSSPSKPAPPPVTQIKVVDGKPAGGITEIDAKKGEQIRFTVSSDVSDEIHVHGYDLMEDVKAGGKVGFSFPAKIDGEFEVELENRGEQIAKLVVNP